jgi:hypothetical protein
MRTERTCVAWGITLNELHSIDEKMLNKYLLQQAAEKPLNVLHEYMQLVSEKELKINQKQTTYVTAGVSSKLLATYLQTRAGLRWGNKGEQTRCPFCPYTPLHTYEHCINECRYSISVRRRDEQRTTRADQDQRLPIAIIRRLTEALTTDNHEDLQYYMTMIHSSPYLFHNVSLLTFLLTNAALASVALLYWAVGRMRCIGNRL